MIWETVEQKSGHSSFSKGWTRVSFYTDFAAGYGTLWLIMLVCAVVTQSHVNAGAFGMFGFPIIALIYAFLRWPGRRAARERMAELEYRLSVYRHDKKPLAGHPFPPTDPPDTQD